MKDGFCMFFGDCEEKDVSRVESRIYKIVEKMLSSGVNFFVFQASGLFTDICLSAVSGLKRDKKVSRVFLKDEDFSYELYQKMIHSKKADLICLAPDDFSIGASEDEKLKRLIDICGYTVFCCEKANVYYKYARNRRKHVYSV